jgi:hypothetical protein
MTFRRGFIVVFLAATATSGFAQLPEDLKRQLDEAEQKIVRTDIPIG